MLSVDDVFQAGNLETRPRHFIKIEIQITDGGANGANILCNILLHKLVR